MPLYTPTPTDHSATTFTVPANGAQMNVNNLVNETAPGANPNLTLGALADWIADVAHPGSRTRASAHPMVDLDGPNTTLVPGLSVAAGDVVNQLLDVPDGAILTAVSFYITPGSHGALPAVMPSFALFQYNIVTGSSSSLTSATDTSANTTAYDAHHAITKSLLSLTIDRSQSVYVLQYTNESSTNSTNNVAVWGATWTASV